jgi:photosystem II stability/assembly factor-like uncharacterized protein
MANSTILYACTPSGLAIFNKPGTLPEWLPPRIVLADQEVTSAWGEPGPPIRALVTANGKLMLSENGGREWDAANLPAGSDSPVMTIFYVAGTNTLFAARYNGQLATSADGGATWTALRNLPAEGCALSLQPAYKAGEEGRFYLLLGESERNVLYMGSPDKGDWQELANDVLKEHEPSALSVASDSGRAYALTASGVLAVSAEGTTVSACLLVGSPPNGRAIAVIPGTDPATPALVVGTTEGIQASADAGTTWQIAELPQGGGVAALDRDPERRDRIYAGTSSGFLFESGNRGQTWQAINPVPTHAVQSIYVMRI